MIQNIAVLPMTNQVRRLIGEELALLRARVRRGKLLRIPAGKDVAFEPRITFKSGPSLGRRGFALGASNARGGHLCPSVREVLGNSWTESSANGNSRADS